jgi:hypothetical protein
MQLRFWNPIVSTVRFPLAIFLVAISVVSAHSSERPSTSPQDVLTYHGDVLRTGWFSSESQLTVTNVNAQSFGRLNTVALDGRVDAEPLYVSQLTIPGRGTRNVLFVVTENNSLYRIDTDSGKIIGHRKFGNPVPYQYKNYDDNVFPVMGILGTPVIDRTAGVVYLVADTYNGKVDTFRLHAVSIATLKDVTPATVIKMSVLLADGSTWTFNPKYHLQRPGLLEANGSIYVAFGSNGDMQPDQSRGSIARYDATTLAFLGSDVTNTLHTNTSYYLSAVWQSGYGVAADSNGDIYFSTGNSDPSTPSYSASFNRPDSVVHLSGDLTSLIDSFTPSDYFQLDQSDTDLGSGGAMLLPDQPGSTSHLVVAGGKDGRAFLLNRDNMGGYTQGGPDKVLQSVNQGGCWCGPAYFVGSDGNPYVLTGGGNGITSWQLTLPAVQLVQKSAAPSSSTDGLPDYGGSIPVVSSNGTMAGTAIAWFVQRPSSSSDSDPGTPVTLQAFDASNLRKQLFSAQAGTWTHAVNSNADLVPTVANGKVYVTSNKQLQIFGLLGAPTQHHVSVPALRPSKPDAIVCPASESTIDALQGAVRKSGTHQFSGTVCHLENNQLQLALRSGRSVSIDISAAFATHRKVVLSPGRAIHVRARIDAKGGVQAERISPSHTLSSLTPADR